MTQPALSARTADATVQVVRGLNGWVITKNGQPAMLACPCCGQPFSTQEVAEKAAALLLPDPW